jgi:hypothetical protein
MPGERPRLGGLLAPQGHFRRPATSGSALPEPSRKIMNIIPSIATAALLTATLNLAFAGEPGAQPFADSTGGSSQARGELVTTGAGGASRASSSGALRPDTSGETANVHADSTGESSAARAEYLLDHAQALLLPGVPVSTRNHYQPYLDSTGGNSHASSERALEAQAASSSDRMSLAIAPFAR